MYPQIINTLDMCLVDWEISEVCLIFLISLSWHHHIELRPQFLLGTRRRRLSPKGNNWIYTNMQKIGFIKSWSFKHVFDLLFSKRNLIFVIINKMIKMFRKNCCRIDMVMPRKTRRKWSKFLKSLSQPDKHFFEVCTWQIIEYPIWVRFNH